MKLLPITIDNKYDYFVDFESNRSVQDAFIIKKSDGSSPIFEFYSKFDPDYTPNIKGENSTKLGILLLTDDEKSYKVLNISQLDIDKDTNNNYRLTIELCDDRERLIENNDNHPIKRDNFKFFYENLQVATTLIVTFRYDNKEVVCRFHLAPPSQIWKAVIDSGSEATQIKVFTPDNKGEHLQLLSYIGALRKFEGNDIDNLYKIQDEGFIQAEGSFPNINKNLYKSIYYVKKNITTNDIKNDTLVRNKSIINFQEPLMMLTRNSDLVVPAFRSNYIKLGNLKIASYGNVDLPTIKVDNEYINAANVGDNFYYRKYMSEYCYHILKHITSIKAKGDKTPSYLSLYVLVPNIYSTLKTRKNLDCIVESINKILSIEEEEFSKYISGFSVTAVSESDASLIGAVSSNPSLDLKDKNCLIMDAGKGTLDFSLIHIDNDNNFKSLTKNGIIGASATINYGFILDLLSAYYSQVNQELTEDELKEIISKGILGRENNKENFAGAGDVALLKKLMDAVDDYKIHYDKKGATPPRYNNLGNANDNSFSLAAFIEWIKKNRYKVPNGYVNGIINDIVKSTIEKIGDSNTIDKVLYAGRGFLFSELREKMNDALKERFKNIEEINISTGDPGSLKTMCLNISSVIDNGKYNPYNAPITNTITSTDKIEPKKKKIEKYIKPIFNKVEKLVRLTTINFEKEEQQVRREYKYLIICTTGINKVQINTTHYELPKDSDEWVKLFISNDNIYIQSKSQTSILEESISTANYHTLLFPSLFPDVSNTADIYIPEQDSADATTEQTESNSTSATIKPTNSDSTSASTETGETDNASTSTETEETDNASTTIKPTEGDSISASTETEETDNASTSTETEETDSASASTETEETDSASASTETGETDNASTSTETEETSGVSEEKKTTREDKLRDLETYYGE